MNQFREDSEKDSLGHGVAEYFRARLQLLAIECEEAGSLLKGKLIPLLVILLSALTAYALITCAIVAFLGKLLRHLSGNPWLDWELVALLMGGLHLIILCQMKKKVTSAPSRPLFEYSRAELQRDRQWIQENNPTKKS